MNIHPTAIIDPQAEIDNSANIGAYSIIEGKVRIGAETVIGPHVVIKGNTRIGKYNQFFQFSSIGEVPQDKKYHGEDSELIIGDNNTVREYVTINRGTEDGGGSTCIGNNNWLMAYIHIAHDCIVGNNTIFANGASLAGHAIVGDHAILGGFTLIHQFCRIGEHAFCGMGSAISKDVPPYVMVNGNPAHPHGINFEGIKRNGFDKEAIKVLKDAYRIIYRSGITSDEAVEKLKEFDSHQHILGVLQEFIATSQRGIVR